MKFKNVVQNLRKQLLWIQIHWNFWSLINIPILFCCQEGLSNFQTLESLLTSDEVKDLKAKMMNRCVVTLAVVAKVLQAVSDGYRNTVTRELDSYLGFLQHLLPKGRRSLLGGLSEQQQGVLADKLNRDVFTPAFLHQVTSRRAHGEDV